MLQLNSEDYLNKGDFIEYMNTNYVVLSTLWSNSFLYAYANKLDRNDSPTLEILIFKSDGNTLSVVEDMYTYESLLNKFKLLLKKDIEEFL